MNDWTNAEAHAERAHQYYEAGQWDKALKELSRALAVNPDQSEWHFGMGLTLEAMGRHQEAAQSFERVLELRGDDVETMVNLALNLNRAEEPTRAIEVLEHVNDIDSNCEQGYCLRVEAYMLLGDHEKAEEMFYMARQIVDECPACYDSIAQSLSQRGLLDKAQWCWHQTVRLEPYYPGVYANLARVHRQRGHHVRAQRLYLKQLRQDPGDVNTLVELGVLLMEMQRLDEANEKFRRALELDCTVAPAHLHLGEMALHQGQYQEAQRQLERARRLDAQLPGIHLGMAQIAYQQHQDQSALDLLREEMRLTAHHPNHLLEMARLLIDLEQPQPVINLLSFVVDQRQNPAVQREQIVTALLYRGVARSMAGDLQGSIAEYRRAVRLEPNHTLAMQNLATAYYEDRRLRRASYWLNRAAKSLPNASPLRELRISIAMRRVAMALGALVPRRKSATA